MRHLRDVLRRTRSSFSRILERFSGRMSAMEKDLAAMSDRLVDIESKDTDSLHGLEVAEDNRKTVETAELESLSSAQLRAHLKVRYGRTKWAAKLIDEIIARKTQAKDVSIPMAG